ncbi:MAG: trimeric intracellular cation channel family protein [Ilumatobacteraceae bacterium]|nr:hypothetical protein [Acidimicrobiia bacterium]
MLAEIDVPDLATNTPLWLGLLAVYVNAVVGALRGYTDRSRHWDIVGVSVFALLMGLGGGFIRDLLIGNLPAESLREPWYVTTVIGGIVTVVVVRKVITRISPIIDFVEALALGLFATIGVAYAHESGLPFINTVLIGTLSAVGGGMLVSVLQSQTSQVLVSSTPLALLAVLGSIVYASVAQWRSDIASFAGVAVVVIAQYVVDHFDVKTRPAGGRSRSS